MRSQILILSFSAAALWGGGCSKNVSEDFDRPRLYWSAIQFTASDAMPYAMPAAIFDLASQRLHAAVGRELAPIQGYEVLLFPQIDSGYRLILLTPRKLTVEEEQRIAKLVSPAFGQAAAEWRTREAKGKNG